VLSEQPNGEERDFGVVSINNWRINDIAATGCCLTAWDGAFKAAAETMLTIAADPKHLGASIAITAVLHTWGSAMTHHPHVHMIVPGGGLSPDGERWIAAKLNFFLPVLVLSRLFRRLMLEKLAAAHKAGKLTFFGAHAHLADAKVFAAFLAPLKRTRWFVYSKRPFAQGGARLPGPLHPPRRHLQQPPDRRRRRQRHLQGQGLPRRGARPLHHNDPRISCRRSRWRSPCASWSTCGCRG